MRIFNTVTSAVFGLAVMATAAAAAPITYFGENLTPGGTVSGDPVTASNAFQATLSGTSTETFDSLANGTSNPNLSFTGAAGNISATLNGAGQVTNSPNAGRFAVSGSNYYTTGGGGDFSISFGSAISAFGFYGTDIGDFKNSLTLVLTTSGGDTVELEVGNTVGSNGSTSGSLLFFGFIDTTTSYTKIAFKNAPNKTDVFGFDNMTVGELEQITNPPSVPVPAGLPLALTALGALGLLRRKKA